MRRWHRRLGRGLRRLGRRCLARSCLGRRRWRWTRLRLLRWDRRGRWRRRLCGRLWPGLARRCRRPRSWLCLLGRRCGGRRRRGCHRLRPGLGRRRCRWTRGGWYWLSLWRRRGLHARLRCGLLNLRRGRQRAGRRWERLRRLLGLRRLLTRLTRRRQWRQDLRSLSRGRTLGRRWRLLSNGDGATGACHGDGNRYPDLCAHGSPLAAAVSDRGQLTADFTACAPPAPRRASGDT